MRNLTLFGCLVGLSLTGCNPQSAATPKDAALPSETRTITAQPVDPVATPAPAVSPSATPTPSPPVAAGFTPQPFHYAPERTECTVNSVLTNAALFEDAGHSYYTCSAPDAYLPSLGFYNDGSISIGATHLDPGARLDGLCNFFWDNAQVDYGYASDFTVDDLGFLTGMRFAKWLPAQHQYEPLIDYTCELTY